MGKSNNLHNKLEKVYKKENHLKNVLKEHEIKMFENINNFFIDQFATFFSNYIKNSVKSVSCNMRIGSCAVEKNIVKNTRCLNLIEILPCKKQFFVILPDNFLSTIIDFLFGGQGSLSDKIKTTDLTSTESLINKKIITFIKDAFAKIYKKYFSLEVNSFNIKTFLNFKQFNFNFNKIFLINSFNFHINSVEVCFDILIPISILEYINKEIFSSVDNNKKNICTEKNIKQKICLDDICNIKLNINAKITGISISHDKIHNLSIGDIISIKRPDKITGFIEDQAIFSGNYKRFNEQSIVFIEEFIDSSLDSNQDKEYFNE